MVVLEEQTEARRSEGDERKVGGCQNETRRPPPIPVNLVYGHFSKCTAVKSATCFRKCSADADPLAPELKLSTNLSFQIFFSCMFLLKIGGHFINQPHSVELQGHCGASRGDQCNWPGSGYKEGHIFALLPFLKTGIWPNRQIS